MNQEIPEQPDQSSEQKPQSSGSRLANPSDDAFVIANGIAELGHYFNEGMQALAKSLTIVGNGLNRIADAMEPEDIEQPPPKTYMDGSPIPDA